MPGIRIMTTMDIAHRSARIEESYRYAEMIASQRKPHLYRVAIFFPDRPRFLAFCAAYASMRWVDDHVDDLTGMMEDLDSWQDEISGNFSGVIGSIVYGPALADTFKRFELPLEPWLNMKKSMQHDLQTHGFSSYRDFLNYAEGATVAPAAVFTSLLLHRSQGGIYRTAVPYSTVRDAVRESAIICYEAHIVRDLKEDMEAGRSYFPHDELKQFGLEQTQTVGEEWRPYIKFYVERALGKWEAASRMLAAIETEMTHREKLMLHLLTEFYIQSLEKIKRIDFDVWSNIHWVEKEEMKALLECLRAAFEPGLKLDPLAIKAIEDV